MLSSSMLRVTGELARVQADLDAGHFAEYAARLRKRAQLERSLRSCVAT